MSRPNRWTDLEERWRWRLKHGALSVESRGVLLECINEMVRTRQANLLTGLASVIEEDGERCGRCGEAVSGPAIMPDAEQAAYFCRELEAERRRHEATRAEVEALRRERDRYRSESVEEWQRRAAEAKEATMQRALAAEAEVERLRAVLRSVEWAGEAWKEEARVYCQNATHQREKREAAEAEVERLRFILRDLLSAAEGMVDKAPVMGRSEAAAMDRARSALGGGEGSP